MQTGKSKTNLPIAHCLSTTVRILISCYSLIESTSHVKFPRHTVEVSGKNGPGPFRILGT